MKGCCFFVFSRVPRFSRTLSDQKKFYKRKKKHKSSFSEFFFWLKQKIDRTKNGDEKKNSENETKPLC